MRKIETDPIPWLCKCGNVLGVRHRNNSKIMVLDAFRGRVTAKEFNQFVITISRIDYSICDLVFGKVVCAKCGRSSTWDASEQLMIRTLKNRQSRSYGLN